MEILETFYGIAFDILGFVDGLKKEANRRGIAESTLKETIKKAINKKIRDLKIRNTYGIVNMEENEDDGSDSWALILSKIQTFDSLDPCFNIIDEIINIKTGFFNLELPFEIGIFKVDLDKNTLELSERPNSIAKVSEKIKECSKFANNFRNLYKKKFNERIESSYVLLTYSAFNDLNNLDKNLFTESKLEKDSYFYILDNDSLKYLFKKIKFLKSINTRLFWGGYRYIDKLFVPPIEFEDFENVLKEHKLMIITGPPQFGKTYSAFKLLWNFYLDGYTPVYSNEHNSTEDLENALNDLRPRHIYYFEDPFGRDQIKGHNLRRDFNHFITTIKDRAMSNDFLVIITSIDETFRKFSANVTTNLDIERYVVNLEMGSPSYDYQKRIDMLKNYGKIFNCNWVDNNTLNKHIFRKVKDLLPTPLSIFEFAKETVYDMDLVIIDEKLNSTSDRSYEALGEALLKLNDRAQRFLIILSIIQPPTFRDDIITCARDLGFDDISNNYEEIILDVKYVIKFNGDDGITFSHNDYKRALKFLIFRNSDFNYYYYHKRFKQIFEDLSRNYQSSVVDFFRDKFLDFPIDFQVKYLVFLLQNEEYYIEIAYILYHHFDKIDRFVRNKLMKVLSDYPDEQVLETISEIVLKRFKDITPNRNRISIIENLSQIIQRGSGAESYLYSIATKYQDKIPRDLGEKIINIYYYGEKLYL